MKYAADSLPPDALEIYTHKEPTYQKDRPYSPQNLILLPSLDCALEVFKAAKNDTNYSTPFVCDHVTGKLCFLSDAALALAQDLARRLADAAREIAPSLSALPRFVRSESADLWDAGLIAEGDPAPCLDYRHDGPEPSKGKGDGAYRILINTDTSFGRSDRENLATMLCLCDLLGSFGIVEIWVQNGWLTCWNDDPTNRASGVTCYRVGQLSSMNPRTLAFFLGSGMRDSILSRLISKKLGRTHGGTSTVPAIPCDLFTQNGNFNDMPEAYAALTSPDSAEGKAQLADLAQWIAKTTTAALFPDDLTAAAFTV